MNIYRILFDAVDQEFSIIKVTFSVNEPPMNEVFENSPSECGVYIKAPTYGIAAVQGIYILCGDLS